MKHLKHQMDQVQDELPSYSLAVGITNNIPAETINQNNSNDAANNRSRNRPPLQMQLSVHRLAIHELKPLPALVPKDNQVEPVTTSSVVNIGVSSISSTNISRQSATSARRLRPFRNFKDTITYLRRVIFSKNIELTRREKSHRERFCFVIIFLIISSVILIVVVHAASMKLKSFIFFAIQI